jgi:hypothetical protein
MRIPLFILVTLLPLLAWGQKAWVAEDGIVHPIDTKEALLLSERPSLSADTTALKTYLLSTLQNLSADGSGLRMEHFRGSPKAMHFQFAQTYRGRKVFRGNVKVNLRPDGKVLSIYDHTFMIPEDVEEIFPEHAAYHSGLLAHYDHRDNGLLEKYTLEEVFFWDGETMQPAIRIEVLEKQDRYYEMILNKDVRVIYQNDLITYFAPVPKDSLVTLWVFNPDPLTTAGQSYGVPYADQEDQDIPELNAERQPAQALVTFDNGTFHLRNSAVHITEFSAPQTPVTTSASNVFNFTRSEPGFEDCNALVHITRMRDHLHQLGFTDLMGYAIHVDAHALNGADNSNFNSGSSPPRLSFGEGGVDDAEDADVIVHEYGHAIMHSAAPNTNTGIQRRAMDEAIGDYFASSYSRALNNFRWADVFTWDGHNEFWPGRSTLSSDHYPEDLELNIYKDADIWSATLMQIWGDIGRNATDAIMLQAAYSFTSGMTMPQAALAFLQADTLLFDGAHFTPIRQHMFDRGLIGWNVSVAEPPSRPTSFKLLGSADFAVGAGLLIIESNSGFSYQIMDATGRLLIAGHSLAHKHALHPDALPSGLYLISVRSAMEERTFKVVRN